MIRTLEKEQSNEQRKGSPAIGQFDEIAKWTREGRNHMDLYKEKPSWQVQKAEQEHVSYSRNSKQISGFGSKSEDEVQGDETLREMPRKYTR